MLGQTSQTGQAHSYYISADSAKMPLSEAIMPGAEHQLVTHI